MTDADFVEAILSDPANEHLRLVYADWLEEQGDRRSEFLRLSHEMAKEPSQITRALLRNRLRKMRKNIDPGWLAQMDRPPIERCPNFAFRCPLRWEDLQETADPAIRYCEECRKDVYYSANVGEARQHALKGRCVAVNTAVSRVPGDLGPRPSDPRPQLRTAMGRLTVVGEEDGDQSERHRSNRRHRRDRDS